MKPPDLIDIARDLVGAAGPRRPRQAYLCRAVSTYYYALFHTLCGSVADLMIGATGSSQGSPPWVLAYRALSHGRAKSVCREVKNSQQFPASIKNFAAVFVEAQRYRHDADYDPSARYSRADVLRDIEDAEGAIKAFKAAPVAARKEFAARLIFKERP